MPDSVMSPSPVRITSGGTHLNTFVETRDDDGTWRKLPGIITGIEIKIDAPGWVTAKITFIQPELNIVAYKTVGAVGQTQVESDATGQYFDDHPWPL